MPKIAFTPNIQRHVACPPMTVAGATVAEVLAAAFADNPRARAYVLDDQGALRRHMIIFVDGVAIKDRTRLSDTVAADGTVYVFQSLSGG
ncbi:MAG: MoaD/ThiS family protein [Hyphomicrobiaceae bacterium]|nr:MoaD/ThiS family protein [Hyphomicrobiaceae bacterium]